MLEGFDTMDTRTLILKHLAPGAGAIVAFIMFVSPLKAVLAARKQKHLGDLNPLPLIAIIANCTAWLIYGCVAQDPYVILANEPGLMLGLFMAVSCYGLVDNKAKDSMLKALLFFAAVISVTGAAISLGIQGHESKLAAAGYLSVFVLLCYYAAPLSVLAEVLRSRSSAQLYWPLSVMSCVNGALWVTYGLAVADNFIMLPNLVGAALGLLQLGLIALFPAKTAAGGARRGRASDDGEVEDPLLLGASKEDGEDDRSH